MRINDGYIKNNYQGKLYYKTWLPEGKPKAVIAILHGVGEHLKRYKNFVHLLVPNGYALTAFDQRGHGLSDGKRGHVDHWQVYRDDLKSFLEIVRDAFADSSIFLYGHSMGALVALDYEMHEHPQGIHGLILSGTPLEPADAAAPAQVFIAKILSGIYPKFTMKVKLPGSSLSRDPLEASAYDEDPLVYRERSARWGTETLNIVAWINNHPEQVSLPVLFIQGEQDPLVRAEGVQRFYNQIKFPDKTIYIYPDTLHEPHNDLCFEQVIADIESWIARHP